MNLDLGSLWTRTGSRVVLAAALWLLAVQAPSSFGLGLARIARLHGADPCRYPCGEANGNGRPEIYSTRYGESLAVFEYCGHDSFSRYAYEISGAGPPLNPASVWEFGYGESDSLSELVAMVGSWDVRILQSPNRHAFPTESIWQKPLNDAHYGFPKFVDFYSDGHKEMGFDDLGYGIWLYEGVGNNEFDSVALLEVRGGWSSYGDFDAGDFDQDGRTEIVAGYVGPQQVGLVVVFKPTGVGHEYTYTPVFTESQMNMSVAAAHDMEGRPEFIVLGEESANTGLVTVYEATGVNQYDSVWVQVIPFNPMALFGFTVSVGDVDGDGLEEFAVTNGNSVLLFKCTGEDTYQQAWQCDAPAAYVKLYDVNADGRAEVLVQVGDSAVDIYEDTEGLSQAPERKSFPEPAQAEVRPAIVRLGTLARFSGLPEQSELNVYSSSGLLVRKQATGTSPAWTWDLTDQHGRPVPAGTYFVLIRCQGQTASTKLCVVN